MIRIFRNPVRGSLRRRLVSSVTLLAYLACAIGFPMPELAAASMNACGQQVCCCGNAEQCRASGCGCSHAPAPIPEDDDVPDCCKKKPEAEPSCCGKVVKKPAPFRWVIGIAAQKCGGLQSNWISADVALPGPTPIDWRPSWVYCHSLVLSQDSPFVLVTDSLDPPPRSCAV